MPDRKENQDEDSAAKPKVNKLMILLIFFLSILTIAMIGSVVMIIKMQSTASQVDAPADTSKAEDAEKDKIAANQTAEKGKEGAKEEKTSDSSAKSTKSGKNEVLKPQYYKLKPAIVVNIPALDKTRFLQVDVELMTRNSSGIENVDAYAPLIRNDLITLFSTQKYEDVITIEGKEELRKKALNIVQKIMKQNTGDPVIEQVLFTNFVSQ